MPFQMRTDTCRILAAFALGTCVLPSALAAQGLGDATVITAPTYTSMGFGSGTGKRTVSQMTLPFVLGITLSERVNIDVTTAYAMSNVVVGGDSTVSEINGLTDTQVRANFRLANRDIVFTVGLNLPTGQYSVPEEQQEAAGQIGNDFLNYPISSMGNGLAGTGGVAYARTAGDWNVGLGASIRKSTEFAAFSVASSDYRFTPADEYRVRFNLDRPVGDGEVSVGLTYSMFGSDVADTTTYSTGDRIILSGGWSFPIAGRDFYLSAWNLYRLAGEQVGAEAPPENVFNVNGAMSFELGAVLLQPNVEVRLWQVDGARAGNLFNVGTRLRLTAGVFTLFPQVGMSFGNVYSLSDGSAVKISGLRGGLTVRYN
jgi:hypothetical protein